MKAPPLIPASLGRLLAIGCLTSCFLAGLAAVSAHYLPNEWLHPIVQRGALGSVVLKVMLTATLGISTLWAVAYLTCWPWLFFQHRAAQRSQPDPVSTGPRLTSAELAAEFYRAQPSDPDAPRQNWERQKNESWDDLELRHGRARQLHAQRLDEVENQVVQAYAHYRINADFLGQKSEQHHLKTFGSRLRALGIPDLGILHASKNPTVRQLWRHAPITRAWTKYDYIPAYPFNPYATSPSNPPASPFIKGYISG